MVNLKIIFNIFLLFFLIFCPECCKLSTRIPCPVSCKVPKIQNSNTIFENDSDFILVENLENVTSKILCSIVFQTSNYHPNYLCFEDFKKFKCAPLKICGFIVIEKYDFGRSVNLISTLQGGHIIAHHNTTCPPPSPLIFGPCDNPDTQP